MIQWQPYRRERFLGDWYNAPNNFSLLKTLSRRMNAIWIGFQGVEDSDFRPHEQNGNDKQF